MDYKKAINQMSGNWKDQACTYFKNKFDAILDIYETDSFMECTGTCGGDKLTFRYYKNGTVTER